jgi:DNA-binding MarR family transcriptional regulator
MFIYLCNMTTTINPIPDIRAFNRFYTDIIGLLDKHLLNSTYSLAEARIIYEIYYGGNVQASQIMTAMNIDKSYLSRLLKKLEKEKLIIKNPSGHDARAMLISLTKNGLEEFGALNKASDEQISKLLTNLNNTDQQELVSHMNSIMNIFKKQQ